MDLNLCFHTSWHFGVLLILICLEEKQLQKYQGYFLFENYHAHKDIKMKMDLECNEWFTSFFIICTSHNFYSLDKAEKEKAASISFLLENSLTANNLRIFSQTKLKRNILNTLTLLSKVLLSFTLNLFSRTERWSLENNCKHIERNSSLNFRHR